MHTCTRPWGLLPRWQGLFLDFIKTAFPDNSVLHPWMVEMLKSQLSLGSLLNELTMALTFRNSAGGRESTHVSLVSQ
jgi:hypothetical protein